MGCVLSSGPRQLGIGMLSITERPERQRIMALVVSHLLEALVQLYKEVDFVNSKPQSTKHTGHAVRV